MRTLIAVAAAVLVAVVLGVRLNGANRPAPDITLGKATVVRSMPPASIATLIPIWEIHNQAHLENLPIQEIDDQSLVFSKEASR